MDGVGYLLCTICYRPFYFDKEFNRHTKRVHGGDGGKLLKFPERRVKYLVTGGLDGENDNET